MTCPGFRSDSSGSAASREGTAAHELAQRCLESRRPAATWIGDTIKVEDQVFTIDVEMAGYVQVYVDYIDNLAETVYADTLIEQQVPLEHMTGEPGATGTSDAVLISGDEIIVVDLKYGRGVPVDAVGNTQLRMYASGALFEHGLTRDFERARMIIVQPRLNSITEDVISVHELEQFERQVQDAVRLRAEQPDLRVVSDKGCRWCSQKATCPALRDEVFEAVEEHDPRDVATDDLADALAKVERIEGWLKAIKAEAEARLLQGRTVRGYKLVAGKKGNRKWTSATEVEALMKAMRLKAEDMYERSLISPTTAEKLSKDHAIGERQWNKLQQLIEQKDGSPTVVPATDRRPEFTPAPEVFSHV